MTPLYRSKTQTDELIKNPTPKTKRNEKEEEEEEEETKHSIGTVILPELLPVPLSPYGLVVRWDISMNGDEGYR